MALQLPYSFDLSDSKTAVILENVKNISFLLRFNKDNTVFAYCAIVTWA